MLVHEELLQDVDRAEVLASMLGEIPWASIRSFVQSNEQLLKRCTAGGHRLETKSRKRIQALLLKEARKVEFAESFCNGLFVPWYPVHEELHKQLEDYFHSDEYKTYREENELADDVYVLSDEIFERFFKLDDLVKWRVLLCFSPLKFSKEQAQRLLDDTEGSAELLGRVAELEDRLQALEKEKNKFAGEAERLKSQYDQASADVQEHRKAQRQLRTESEGLQKKLEVALAENKRFRESLQKAEQVARDVERTVSAKLKKKTVSVRNDLERVNAELSNWQAKYEQQRVENRNLEKEIEEAREDLKQGQRELRATEDENEALDAFADAVLSKIDWAKVGLQLKLTPTLRQQFNSLIRKLNYEDDRTLTIEGTLAEFWDSLLSAEKELVHNIAESNTREVASGDVENYWLDLTDSFADVRISLEARTVLIKMLQEIFYQVIEIEDLESPTVLRKKPSRKARQS